MPEGRFVNKRISDSEQLGRVSLLADYLFTKCIPHLDVTGRITGNPVLLKAKVAPLRAEITTENIPDIITELANALGHEGDPLVRWYEVNGQSVLRFPGFARQQKGLKADREATSKFPEPPQIAPARTASGARKRKAKVVLGVDREEIPTHSRASPDQVGSESGSGPPKGSRMEGEGEVKEEVKHARGGWPAALAAIFTAHIGTISAGECGACFADAIGEHGEERVIRAVTAWAKQAPATEKPQFLTPKACARQVGAWVKRTEPILLYDERSGDITPEAALILGRVGS